MNKTNMHEVKRVNLLEQVSAFTLHELFLLLKINPVLYKIPTFFCLLISQPVENKLTAAYFSACSLL